LKKLDILPLLLIVLFSMFVALPVAFATESEIQKHVAVVYAYPSQDDSMTNPDYALLRFHWYSTISPRQ